MSQIKKATQFIKKLKHVTTINKDSIIKEIKSVKLENYLLEVISAMAENLYASNTTIEDIYACADVYSALKDKFKGDFYYKIAELFKKTLLENKTKIAILRNILCTTSKLQQAEFFVYKLDETLDAFDSIMGGGTLVQPSKKALKFDGAKFTKDLYKYICDNDVQFDAVPMIIEYKTVFPDFFNLFTSLTLQYFNTLKDHMHKLNKTLVKSEKYERDCLFNKGVEMNDDLKLKKEEMTVKFNELLPLLQILCDTYNEELPVFEKLQFDIIEQGQITLQQNSDLILNNAELWEEVEDPLFYKDILDLRTHVPRLFESNQPTDTEEEDIEDLDMDKASDDVPTSSTSPTITHTPLSICLDQLQQVNTQEQADKYAIEFCHFNSKLSRKKLVKQAFKFSKRNSHAILYYTRIIKILSKYFPDISETFQMILKLQFRQPLNHIMLWIGESLKFQIISPHLYIYYLQALLQALTPNSILSVCFLLNQSGRYMLKLCEIPINEPLLIKYKDCLELLVKNKYFCNVTDQRFSSEIENTMSNLYTNTIHTIEYGSPLLHFITSCLSSLTETNKHKILKFILKCPQSSHESLSSTLADPTVVNFTSIKELVWIYTELKRYYPLFAGQLIDQLCSTIQLDFKLNHYKYNQRRIACMVCISECFKQNLVKWECLLDILFYTVTYGTQSTTTTKLVDHPLDYFRIRLFGTVLRTCGKELKRKCYTQINQIIDCFYNYYKQKQLVPLDMVHFIRDCFKEGGFVFLKSKVDNQESREPSSELIDSTELLEPLEPLTEQVNEVIDGNGINEELEDMDPPSDSNSSATDNEEQLELELEAEMALMMVALKKKSTTAIKLKDVVIPINDGLKSNEKGIAFSLLTRKKPKVLYMDKQSQFATMIEKNKEKEVIERKAIKHTTLKLESNQ